MGAKHLHQAQVFGLVLGEAFQFVATGAEGTGGGVAQGCNGFCRLLASVDQVLPQSADDAIETGVDFADLVLVLACCLDDATGAGVDHRCDAAGLGVEKICFGHVFGFLRWYVAVVEFYD